MNSQDMPWRSNEATSLAEGRTNAVSLRQMDRYKPQPGMMEITENFIGLNSTDTKLRRRRFPDVFKSQAFKSSSPKLPGLSYMSKSKEQSIEDLEDYEDTMKRPALNIDSPDSGMSIEGSSEQEAGEYMVLVEDSGN